jgi:hypothetical protein
MSTYTCGKTTEINRWHAEGLYKIIRIFVAKYAESTGRKK